MSRKKSKNIKDKELNKLSGGTRPPGARAQRRGRGSESTAPATPTLTPESGETGGTQPPTGNTGRNRGIGEVERGVPLRPRTGPIERSPK